MEAKYSKITLKIGNFQMSSAFRIISTVNIYTIPKW
jgi:hypothetical protein